MTSTNKLKAMAKRLVYVLCPLLFTVIVCSCACNVDITGKEGAAKETVKGLLYISWWIALLFIGIAFILSAIVHWLENQKWINLWKRIEGKLTFLFIIVWIAGFCVYSVGMYIDGAGQEYDFQKLFSVSCMAVLHAFGMFLLESDISAIHEQFHESLYFMTWFSTVHFAAACVSMIFVIKHFGYNIIAGVHLWFSAYLSNKKDNLYVFWGMNNASYFLAKDITENAPKTETHRILFVKTSDDDESLSERTGIDRLLNFLSVKNNDLKKYKELKCLTTNAFHRLSRCEISDEERLSGEVGILKDKLGLHSLVHLFGKTKKYVHIFILGEDEDSNIKATVNLTKDKDLISLISKCRVTIHCHARYDSVNKVLEDSEYAEKIEIRIIDSAHISIETLKSNKESFCLPVDFVDVKEDATVASPFNSMVIGMGQCGRDAVRFLYEYSTFVAHGKLGGDTVCQSEFRCDVFDKDMERLAPTFRSYSSGADISGVYKDLDIYSWHKINLYNANHNEQLFFDFVERYIKHENYIVISIHNDEEGMALAVRLLKLAIKKGTDIEKFRIFVRSYDAAVLNHMEEIANFYNESVVKALDLKKNKKPVYIFGGINKLYTWHNIIDESLKKDAYRYYNSYEGFNETDPELGTKWYQRRKNRLGVNPPFSYVKLNEIRRMEHEDMKNAQHHLTKLRLIQKAIGTEANHKEFAEEICSEERHADNTYGTRHEWQIIMDTLAQTEHLRWNASHEMMGYTYNENVKKTERDRWMQHTCLTSWENLTTDTQGYDYKVVETSLKMYLEEQNKNKTI